MTTNQSQNECTDEDDRPTIKMKRCEVDVLMEVVEIQREMDHVLE